MERTPHNAESNAHRAWEMKSLRVERDGRVIGTLDIIDIPHPVKVSYLDIMTVALEHRGKGVGKELLQEFMEYVTANKRVGLLLNVIPNDHPARGMYASMGWRAVPDHADWMQYNAEFSAAEAGERLHEVITSIQQEYI